MKPMRNTVTLQQGFSIKKAGIVVFIKGVKSHVSSWTEELGFLYKKI